MDVALCQDGLRPDKLVLCQLQPGPRTPPVLGWRWGYCWQHPRGGGASWTQGSGCVLVPPFHGRTGGKAHLGGRSTKALPPAWAEQVMTLDAGRLPIP